MSSLTDEQLTAIGIEAVNAAMGNDDQGVLQALVPLEETGDYVDAYRLTLALIRVVKGTLPAPSCPTHGPDSTCHPVVGIGIVAVDAETGEPLPVNDDGDIMGSVTPEIEQTYPHVIGYMRMLVADINDDADMSIALWHAAVEADYATRILFLAIDNAAAATISVKAGLQ
jgi:hypothetical protein